MQDGDTSFILKSLPGADVQASPGDVCGGRRPGAANRQPDQHHGICSEVCVRYLFSGLMRDNGQPVEGHIEAADVDTAYDMLSGHGVVASSVIPDPKPLNIHEELPDAPELADALESALDSSSSQVNFDDLTEQYRGKRVWVIDRDKIRRRVAQVVDTAFHLSQTSGESHQETQERIRTALHGLFSDNRNLASERNASSVMGMKYNPTDAVAPRRPMSPPGSMTLQPVGGLSDAPPLEAQTTPSGALEDQISRLTDVVSQAETVIAALRAASRGLGRGDSGGRRQSKGRTAMNDEKNDVLLTIYKSNVELLKAYKESTTRSAG